MWSLTDVTEPAPLGSKRGGLHAASVRLNSQVPEAIEALAKTLAAALADREAAEASRKATVEARELARQVAGMDAGPLADQLLAAQREGDVLSVENGRLTSELETAAEELKRVRKDLDASRALAARAERSAGAQLRGVQEQLASLQNELSRQGIELHAAHSEVAAQSQKARAAQAACEALEAEAHKLRNSRPAGGSGDGKAAAAREASLRRLEERVAQAERASREGASLVASLREGKKASEAEVLRLTAALGSAASRTSIGEDFAREVVAAETWAGAPASPSCGT